MPRILLGPLLRYVDATAATVWVEVDRPCRVQVLDAEAPSFEVEGHHYALVRIRGLEAGSTRTYEVLLDGESAWPLPEDPYPPPVIRTLPGSGAVRLAFGSCRITAPHRPPFTLLPDEDPRGIGADALFALAARLREQPHAEWPNLLMLFGDQIYADDVPPEVEKSIRANREIDRPHGDEVANFEEYTSLYQHAWGDPEVRWLLSTLPSAMVWDDHDIHDDWNTSASWLEEVRAQDWWAPRIEGAIMAYWTYQHIGNLAPDELEDMPVWPQVAADPGALRDFARRVERDPTLTRWSFARELGSARLVVIDSRASRVLEEENRSMLDEQEWSWLDDHLRGDVDHLLLATSLPALLAGGLHHFEAWNEAVCAGAWGKRGLARGEKIRRELDLEHWAAFLASLERLLAGIGEVAAGERGRAPASVVLLSGDVHHSYLADVSYRGRPEGDSAVYQAVSSPIRHPLNRRERIALRTMTSRTAGLVTRALARTAGVKRPPARWRTSAGPWFENQCGTLDVNGERLLLTFDKAVADDDGTPSLEPLFERRLA